MSADWPTKFHKNAQCYLPDRKISDEHRAELFSVFKSLHNWDPKPELFIGSPGGDRESLVIREALTEIAHNAGVILRPATHEQEAWMKQRDYSYSVGVQISGEYPTGRGSFFMQPLIDAGLYPQMMIGDLPNVDNKKVILIWVGYKTWP